MAESKIANGFLSYYYNANTDRSVVDNRKAVVQYLCGLSSKGVLASVRYSSGYYYAYLVPNASSGTYPILEIAHDGTISVWRRDSGGVFSLVKTFS